MANQIFLGDLGAGASPPGAVAGDVLTWNGNMWTMAQPSAGGGITAQDQSPTTQSIQTGKTALMVGPITIAQGQTITIVGTGLLRII